jgi:hypothetical protein
MVLDVVANKNTNPEARRLDMDELAPELMVDWDTIVPRLSFLNTLTITEVVDSFVTVTEEGNVMPFASGILLGGVMEFERRDATFALYEKLTGDMLPVAHVNVKYVLFLLEKGDN